MVVDEPMSKTKEVFVFLRKKERFLTRICGGNAPKYAGGGGGGGGGAY